MRLLAPLGLAVALLFAGSATATPSTSHLTRIYRGDDGSALYTRVVETTLYGFAEHPGTKLAFVLKGSISGDLVQTEWWDVPKGAERRVSNGLMTLQWTQRGARLVRKSGSDPGPDVWQSIPAEGIQWPDKLVAGFQATAITDVTGAFAGDDGARYYVRQAGNDVVWVAEKESQPGERPEWVSVFVGKRTSNFVNGRLAHVRKGVEAAEVDTIGVSVKADRTLKIGNANTRRQPTLTPDYALDLAVFTREVEKAVFGRNSVGWSFAIAQNGIVVVRKAGGLRLLAANGGPKPFTVNTKSQAASTSKTLTAAVLMRVLLDRGVSVDAKFAPYLPSCWKPGKGVAALTFRDLLAHDTGFSDTRVDCDDPYECLQKAIEQSQGRKLGYQNVNYALMRVLVPLVDTQTEVRKIFESRACKNAGNAINGPVSQRFRARLTKLLEPHGVEFAFYVGGKAADYACVYDNRNRKTKGRCPRDDFVYRAGAGYVAISAVDYAEFLSAFDRGLIVPKATAEAMKTGRLGFDRAATGKAGSYVWKNGGCPVRDGGIACSAMAMIFPGNVQAYAMTNSGRNGPKAGSNSLDETLRDAFDAALR